MVLHGALKQLGTARIGPGRPKAAKGAERGFWGHDPPKKAQNLSDNWDYVNQNEFENQAGWILTPRLPNAIWSHLEPSGLTGATKP